MTQCRKLTMPLLVLGALVVLTGGAGGPSRGGERSVGASSGPVLRIGLALLFAGLAASLAPGMLGGGHHHAGAAPGGGVSLPELMVLAGMLLSLGGVFTAVFQTGGTSAQPSVQETERRSP